MSTTTPKVWNFLLSVWAAKLDRCRPSILRSHRRSDHQGSRQCQAAFLVAWLVFMTTGGFAGAQDPAVSFEKRGENDAYQNRLTELLFGKQSRMPVRISASAPLRGPDVHEGPAGLKGYVWDFGRTNDNDHDLWPDSWGRREGRGYPNYIEIGIESAGNPTTTLLRNIDAWLLGQDAYIDVWQWVRKNVPLVALIQPPSPQPIVMINRFATHPVLPILPPTLPDLAEDNYLRFQMNGGLAEVWSTVVPTNRAYQYQFRCQAKTTGLKHDRAIAELVFLDETDQEVDVHAMSPITGTTPWTRYQIDHIRPPQTASKMLVRLRIEGSGDGLQDIRGEIGFDEIRIEQFPQLRVETDRERGVYWVDQPIDVTARVMGLGHHNFSIRFRMLDQYDREIATKLVPIRPGAAFAAGISGADTGNGSSEADRLMVRLTSRDDVRVDWSPPLPPPGFYRFTAALEDGHRTSLASETTVVVIDRLVDRPVRGPYGWTLDNFSARTEDRPDFSPESITQWLQALGVSRVKIPAWLGPDDHEGAERLTQLFRRLQDAGIQTVGMLDVPPRSRLSMYDLRGADDEVAAQLFRDEKVWQSELEPVMTRLTLKCRVWQLGADGDHSFLGRPGLRDSVQEISRGLQGFGQPLDLALSWPWLEPLPPPEETSWQANCRTLDLPMTSDELHEVLTRNESTRKLGPRTWMLMDPIRKDQYSRDARILDLVLRMATIRNHRVEASFVSRPTDTESGLLRPNGRPGELLLPWRTTSRLLGDLRYIGSIEMRSGAQNAVFAGNGRAVMMVWSDQPTQEEMYLGDQPRQIDVWGRSNRLQESPGREHPVHRFVIGKTPTFLVDIDPTLIAFRMSVALQPAQLDSLLGISQPIVVSYSNPTDVSLLGTLRMVGPTSWQVQSPLRPWEILPHKGAREVFNVILENDTTVGDYEIPIRFQFQTTPPRSITVYRDMHIGPEGLELQATTRMVGSEMLVQLELTNSGPRTRTYQFILFPRNGRQDKRLILSVQPGKTVKRFFGLEDGEELVGQTMWLRAIEQDSDRVLNYTITGTR
ncbi:hypothetical protein [Crateriforma spongiae]|uniref:hypothetical protein n=1 Tax=Crateriforma spongiae TaxID=2724528 RepID=UPI0039AF649A